MQSTTRLVPACLGHTARLLGGTLAALLWAGSASARSNPDLTLIEDTFTADSGTGIEGRTPSPTNLPGGNWARQNTYWASSIQGDAFQMGPDNGWTVPLASSGAYARPSKLRLSADLTVNNLDNGSGNGGGISLGFNSQLGCGAAGYTAFCGLRLDRDGTLTFRRDNADRANVPWSGSDPAFNPTNSYHLSYEVDTLSGDLSNVQLTDNTADFSSLVSAAAGQFTPAHTAYASFHGNSGNGGSTGYLDNFKVERVGDPLAPSVSLTPADGSKWTPDASLVAAADVVDGVGPLTVKIYLDGVQVGTDITSPPYQLTVGTLALCSHQLYATVTDSSPTPVTVTSATSHLTVQAATGLINVDFNSLAGPTPTFSGAAAIGSAGDLWNGLDFPDGWSVNNNAYAFTTVQDSHGATLGGLRVALAGNTQCFDPWGPNCNGSGYNDLTQDYIAYDPHFTVSGLAAGNYDFYLIGTRGTYAPVSVNGGAPKTFNGLSGTDTPTLEEGRDYLLFPGVIVGGDGMLEFHATDLGADGWAYRIAGFQIRSVAPNTPQVVSLTRPAAGQQYSTESAITAVADFYYGTPPFTVQFFVDGSKVGGDVTAAPYQMSLGSLALGTHHIYTKVMDSSTGGGGPFTVSSATTTFTVAAPAITVDKDYTFNDGPEADLVTEFYQTGTDPPVYTEGQVILPPLTRLKGTLSALAPVNFGMEIIMTQTSDTFEGRWLGACGSQGPFQFILHGKDYLAARDDQVGEYAPASGVTVDTEYRVAMVVTQSPGEARVLKSFYRNGVLIGSRSDPANDSRWTNPMSDLWVGAWNQGPGQTGWDTTPSVIKVNQVRLFHFAPDLFSPSLLLAAATPVPDRAPAIALATPPDGQLFLTPDAVALSSTVAYGTAPFTVHYSMRPLAGSFVTVGTSSSPPYAVNLGTLAAGTYELQATVTDSAGTPRTSTSAIRTITVATPSISVDRDYTFNAGAEADLVAYGSDAPIYADGQVILPPRTFLRGTNVLSNASTNFGMEVILTQQESTSANRFVASALESGWNGDLIQFHLEGNNWLGARSDFQGDWAQASGVAAGMEHRAAVVITRTGDSQALISYYYDNNLVGSRLDTSWVLGPPQGYPMSDLFVGAWQWNGGDTGDGTPAVIKVNEVRVFHFDQGMFHPSLLLTEPTGGVTPPVSTYATWASDMGIAGQPANGDADHDGVPNAVEMVLGGDPKNAMDAGLMPTLAEVTNPAGVPAGDYLEFTYRRTDLSVSAGITAECQFNTDLGTAWTTAQDGVGGVKVLVTNDYAPYGAATARVQVYVPRAGHATLFARLHVAVP